MTDHEQNQELGQNFMFQSTGMYAFLVEWRVWYRYLWLMHIQLSEDELKTGFITPRNLYTRR